MRYLKIYENFEFDKEIYLKSLKSIKDFEITPLQDKQSIGDVYSHLFIKLVNPIGYYPYPDSQLYKREVKCITIGKYHTKTTSFGSINFYESMDEASSDIPLRNNVTIKAFGVDSWEGLNNLLKRRSDPPANSDSPIKDELVNVLDYNPINYQEIENILDDLGYELDVENIWGILA